MPAIFRLARRGWLAPDVDGYGRSPMTDDAFRARMREAVPSEPPGDGAARPAFAVGLSPVAGAYDADLAAAPYADSTTSATLAARAM